MLSVSGGMAAEAATSYFSKEDYYMIGCVVTEWLGMGAETLGLTGTVHKDDFKAVAKGNHPQTGELLVATKITKDMQTDMQIKTHRAGNDLTFSAPKSVSVAYAADATGIKEAHDFAVKSVCTHIEQHYCHARTPEGFENGSLIAPKFDHATSRTLDPQLHSHLFICNVTQTQDGQFRANEPLNLFKDQKKLGELYRQELASQLKQQGYEINYTDRTLSMFEIRGIAPDLIDQFSKRRAAIEKQVEVWKSNGEHKGVSEPKMYEMAALKTRQAKNRSLTREDVVKAWDQGFKEAGTTREAVKEQLEVRRQQVLFERQHLPAEPNKSSYEVIQQAAVILTDKEAIIDRSQLLLTAVRISGGQHSIMDLNHAIEAVTERLGQDKKGREHYTTSEMRELEARNAEALKNLPKFKSKTNREEVEKYLDSLAKNEGIKLTAGQRQHVINELAGKGGFSLTQGDPGTGKTFCSKIVERFNNEVLKPSGREQISLNVAYTGKAASEMALASGQPANTIDTFLNLYNVGKIQIVHKEGTQVVLKVDEASFMGARQAEHLINVVKNLQGKGITAKLELVGDSKQMQSILAGDLFRQAQSLAKDGKGDFSALKEINRQQNPELLQVAQTLNRDGDSKRLGNNAKEALQMLGKQGRVTEISDSIKLIRATVDKYILESSRPSNYEAKAVAGEKQSVLLVTGTNADRKELNHEIREARIRSGQIERGQTCKILTPAQQGPTADSYKPGQVIQFSGYRSDRGQTKAWGAPLQSQGVVQSINADNNTVNVTYQFTRNNESKTVTKTLDAAVMVNRTTAYNTEDRQFSAGDKIVMLKNDKSIDVKNGQIGEVVSLDDKGYLKVKIDGAEKSFSLNQYSNVDHGYAVTIHKSQGATVESVVQFANVRFGQEATNFNAMNVAITRATHEAHIMTNSIVELEKTVQSNSQKTTTLDRMSEFPLQQDHVAKHVTPSEQDIFQVPYHGAEHVQVDIETSIQKLESEMTSGTAFNEQDINKLDHAIAVLSSELAEYDQSIFHSQEVYQAQNEQIMETGQQQDIEQEM